jgi:uncharacterized protein
VLEDPEAPRVSTRIRRASARDGYGSLVAEPKLNRSNGEIVIPARERPDVDWRMANRIATENRDFMDYVKLIRQFHQTGEARAQDWDGPPDPQDDQ